MQKGKLWAAEALQIAEKRGEAKGKGEKGRYTHLKTNFQSFENCEKCIPVFLSHPV